jgi:hypothetical protein
MPKLGTKVPKKMDAIIRRLMISNGIGRGKAVAYLMHLARCDPTYEEKEFGNSQDASANYGMAQDEYVMFRDFRICFDPPLSTDKPFFEKAIRIGASLYEDGYRLSDDKKLSEYKLVSPQTGNGAVPQEPQSGVNQIVSDKPQIGGVGDKDGFSEPGLEPKPTV